MIRLAGHPRGADELVLHQAVVRPDHLGRTHPDPRADPATEVLDPFGARTTELVQVGPDTDEIPVVRDPGTAALPAVAAGSGPLDGEPAAGEQVASGRPNGLALALSSLLGALGGLVSWVVAARVMPTAAVGDAQLVVSAIVLVGGLAQLGIGVGLVRWVPTAGRHTGRLVWTALLLVMPLSGLVGLVYGLLTPRLAGISAGPGAPAAVGLLLLVLACAARGLFSTHDLLLVALGRPWWAVWRSGLFAVVRVGALVGLVAVAGLGAHGVVQSWVGTVVVWVVLGSAVLAVLTRRAGVRAVGGTLPSRAAAAAFLAPVAAFQIGATLLHHQVPIAVNLRFGPETGAVFFVAWQAVTIVDLAAAHFTGSRAAARRRLLVLFLPTLAVAAVLAGPLLSVFGPAYAEAGTVLRLLLLGLAFRLVAASLLDVRRAPAHGVGFAGLQLAGTVLVLVVAVVVPDTGGGVAALLPVAVGYIVVQVACAVAARALPAARRADVEVPAP